MANTPIINTFEKGMAQDSLLYLQPKGTFRYAKNMTLGDRKSKGYGLAVEESNKLLHDYKEKIIGAKYIESLDAVIIFTVDGTIHLYDINKKESIKVAQDKEFGCNWGFSECDWIRPDFKTDQPCNELKVYWSSGCDYYVVNIAEMLNPERKAALKMCIAANTTGNACGYSCDHFRLMKCVCQPNLTATTTETGGHSLESGSYQFVVQLLDNGGNETNWFSISNPISVGSENNQPGERTKASIKIDLTGLDCRYDLVRIAVIKSVDQVVTAEVVAERSYNTQGITYTYTGQIGRSVDLKEIKAKRKTFIRGRELISKDSRLWLYGIRQEKNLNMQKRVLEEAIIDFVEIEVTPAMAKKYNLMTYERGENYLFGVVYNYCDGTYSSTFLARPNGATGGPTSSSYQTPPTPSGTARETKRPRGNASVDGVTYGCPGGNCGQGGDGTTATTRGSDTAGGGSPLDKIDTWDTDTQDFVDSAKCDDCHEPHCCDEDGNPVVSPNPNCAGCTEDEEAYAADVPKLEDIIGNNMDELADYNQDNDPTYTNGTFKSTAEKLIESIDNSEYRVIKKENFTINDIGATASSGAAHEEGTEPSNPVVGNPTATGNAESKGVEPNNETVPTAITTAEWSDPLTDASGVHLMEMEPKVIQVFTPWTVRTNELYPDQKDCNGEFLYGSFANQQVELFAVPGSDVLPIVESLSTLVPSKYSVADPINSVKIKLIGLQATSIPKPNPEDLPKPLCPNNPYSIVMVPRDDSNSTVQAKGYVCGTFTGQANGKRVQYVRHGCNSRTRVDRWVDNNGSRMGNAGVGPGHAFYGLDTAIGQVPLSGTELVLENTVRGTGFRYGLYEKGKEPSDALGGRRIDQRGARQYINLNTFQPNNGGATITACGYVKANTLASVDGASTLVSALHRESFVYVETGGIGIVTDYDSSFTTDTLDHACPIPDAYMAYGYIRRTINGQYGSVTGMAFVKTGLEGKSFNQAYRAIAGDTFIGPFSFVKKGYVSDKVGNTFPTPERDRTVCDSPNDLLTQVVGLDWYSTQLPLTGDKSDAKNWAGGHEDKSWSAAYPTEPTFDYYYPKLVKTGITVYIESRINPWLRATGIGDDQRGAGQVYIGKLKNLFLDSAYSSDKHLWEESFLNRFYYRLEQPSPAQLLKKFLIKVLVYAILPAGGLLAFDASTVATGVWSTLITPTLVAYWYMAKKLLTREDYLDKMIGLPICKTDAQGGEVDNYVENFEDNYYDYNYDYSRLNTMNFYHSMPLGYNTCDCNNCNGGETTNEVFYSNKQIQGSTIDFYKQFGALSYLDVSADVGKLTNMFIQNGDLYAHTTDGILPLKYREYGETSSGMSRLGGELMFDPMPLLEGVTEGFCGLVDPNCAINTVHGYAFIDRPSRKFYLFDGRTPKALSVIALDKLFKEHLDFCEIGACHDEKIESSTYYSLGYDPQYYRILITKKELDSKKSFTIGIDLTGEMPAWDGFHDYIPQSYVWDRNNLFTTKDKKLWLQNANDGTYRTFYDKEYPSEIEFVAIANSEAFTYVNTEINSEAEKDNKKNLDVTFNKMALYNTTQGTGTAPTKVYGDNRDTKTKTVAEQNTDSNTIKLNKINRIFRTNEPKDRVKKDCQEQAMTIKQPCIPIEEVNEVIFDCQPIARQQFEGRTIVDDHIVYRLIYDEDNKTLLRLLSVKTNVDISKADM